MTENKENMPYRQLLEWVLASGSRDEIHATIQAWLRANPHPVVPPLYAVFGYPLTRPGDRELLGVYTSLERAEAFVGAQDEAVQQNLRVEGLDLDRYPTDDFWKKPEAAVVNNEEGDRSLGRRLVELLKGGELLPDDAVAAIEAARNRDRDVGALQNRIVELENKNELLRKLVAGGADIAEGRTRPAAEVLEELRAVARGERKLAPLRRAMLESPVAQNRFLSQLAQIRKGVLDPQVADQTAADHERLRERFRVLKDLEDELRRAWGWPCGSE